MSEPLPYPNLSLIKEEFGRGLSRAESDEIKHCLERGVCFSRGGRCTGNGDPKGSGGAQCWTDSRCWNAYDSAGSTYDYLEKPWSFAQRLRAGLSIDLRPKVRARNVEMLRSIAAKQEVPGLKWKLEDIATWIEGSKE